MINCASHSVRASLSFETLRTGGHGTHERECVATNRLESRGVERLRAALRAPVGGAAPPRGHSGGRAIFPLSVTAAAFSRVPSGGTPRMFDGGVITIALLALWRPVESLIEGRLLLLRKRRLYERLPAIRGLSQRKRRRLKVRTRRPVRLQMR
jgi:hypothetical protein